MSLRAAILAWLFAPLAVLAALLAERGLIAPAGPRFAGAQVGVIGSSLMAHALPERGALPDGRSLRRYGIAVPSEEQLLQLVEAAVDEKVPLIVIEAAPWISDFRFEAEQNCAAPAAGLRRAVHGGQVQVVDRLRRLFGLRTSLDGMGEPGNLAYPQQVNMAKVATFYPLRFHEPCLSWPLEGLIRRARAQGTRVVVVLMPRAPVGEAALGREQSLQLLRSAKALAAGLGVSLVIPNGPWPDAQFVDHAHLGANGRAHFMADLAVQLEARK